MSISGGSVGQKLEKLVIEPRFFSDLNYQSSQFSIQYSQPEPGILKVIYSGYASLNDIKIVYKHSLIMNERLCKLPGYYYLLSNHIDHKGNDFKAQRFALKHFRWDTPPNLVSTEIVGLSAFLRVVISVVQKFSPQDKIRHYATESEALETIRNECEQRACFNGSTYSIDLPEAKEKSLVPFGIEDIFEAEYSIVTEHIHEGVFFFTIKGDINKESLLRYIDILDLLQKWAHDHDFEFVNILDTIETQWRSDIYKLLYEILPGREKTSFLSLNIASPRRKGYVTFLKKLFPDFLKNLEFVTSREDALAFLIQRKQQFDLRPPDVLVIPNDKKSMHKIILEQAHTIKYLQKQNQAHTDNLANLVTHYLMSDQFEPQFIEVQPFEQDCEFYDHYNLLQYDLANLLKDLRLEVSERRRAEIQAEKANQAKSKFLAVMSHELRTPLNSVLGFSKALLLNKPNNLHPQQIDYLKRIHQSGKHLLQQVNDILDLSKLEAGKTEFFMEHVLLPELILEISQSFEMEIKKQGLKLVLDLPQNTLAIITDKRAMQQILVNLISNAIKFTSAGQVTVTLIVNTDSRPEKIIIKDTGIGIASEDQQQIFEAFSQVDSGENRIYEGTGLGLSICLVLCQKLEYQISVESNPGQGSDFTLKLDANP